MRRRRRSRRVDGRGPARSGCPCRPCRGTGRRAGRRDASGEAGIGSGAESPGAGPDPRRRAAAATRPCRLPESPTRACPGLPERIVRPPVRSRWLTSPPAGSAERGCPSARRRTAVRPSAGRGRGRETAVRRSPTRGPAGCGNRPRAARRRRDRPSGDPSRSPRGRAPPVRSRSGRCVNRTRRSSARRSRVAAGRLPPAGSRVRRFQRGCDGLRRPRWRKGQC